MGSELLPLRRLIHVDCISLKRVKLFLYLVQKINVAFQHLLFLLVLLILFLVHEFVLLPHRFMHAVSLVAHFLADLALASHLVLFLLVLLALLLDLLLHQLSLLFLLDLRGCIVD